jgi:TDG/mug DNA glycosylase family protein
VSALIGHQTVADWMGEEIVTLADLWPAHPRAAIVGVNQAPCSVEVGHYYQGRNARTALARLRAVGLLPAHQGGHDDDEALSAGIAFTDVVKRPTGRATELSAAELAHGRQVLEIELSRHEVPLVVCMFKPAAQAILGDADKPGIQRRRAASGSVVFRMPGPYDARERVTAAMGELAELLSVWNPGQVRRDSSA